MPARIKCNKEIGFREKIYKLFSALTFIFTAQVFVAAQAFDLSSFLEATQTVAKKTAYQGWLEYASDYKRTDIAPNGKRTSYSYESICSRKFCTSIPVAKNDKRFSEKKIGKYREQASKMFIKTESRPDSVDYGEKENLMGYGISIYDWFSPNLYLKICKTTLADKTVIDGRPTLKIAVADCEMEKLDRPGSKTNLQFMTKTDGVVWIDEQDKAITKMEIYARKEFPNLSKSNEPLAIIEAGKVADGYWFWKSFKVKALDNKSIFPKYKNNMDYEFINYRIPNVEIKSTEINKNK